MTSVALADGDLDPRERALLDQFRDAMTDELLPTNVRFNHADDVRALLGWMMAVALADGPVVEDERLAMREIARAHGADEDALQAIERDLTTRA
jgi:tellurite resistance protein